MKHLNYILIFLVLVVAIFTFYFFRKKISNRFNLNSTIEKTFAIIKPDAVAAKNGGKIIDRIEQEGFKIIGLKKILLSKEQAEKFYAVHAGKPFFNDLVSFMTSGPVIVMVLEKENAISDWRKLMGATDPATAEPNTLRKLYGTNKGSNATHGSDAPETAKIEIGLFFPEL